MRKIISFVAILCCLMTVNWSAKALTYTVTVPEGTQACFIAGSMNGWSINLSANSRMTKVEGVENQFTIDFPDASETDGYHYYCGPDWGYAEVKADGSAFADGENRTWTDSDVVSGWTKDFVMDERTVSIEVLVPSTVQVLYITGQFNGWSGDFKNSPYQMTLVSEDADGKVFSIDNISYIDVINMQFRVVAGPDWAYQNSGDNLVYGSTENTAYFDVKNFDAIFDPTKAGDIKVTATVPEGTDRVWIMGSFAGWSWGDDPESPSLEMTKQEDGTFTYTVPNVETFTYNLYNWPGGDWGWVEAEDNGGALVKHADRTATFVDDADVHITVSAWMRDAPTTVIPKISVDNFIVNSVDRHIVVEGAFSQVAVFDITGLVIQSVKASGMFTSRSLPAGIYIVRVDGVSKKMIVK